MFLSLRKPGNYYVKRTLAELKDFPTERLHVSFLETAFINLKRRRNHSQKLLQTTSNTNNFYLPPFIFLCILLSCIFNYCVYLTYIDTLPIDETENPPYKSTNTTKITIHHNEKQFT